MKPFWIVFIVLCAIGGGGYYWWSKQSAASQDLAKQDVGKDAEAKAEGKSAKGKGKKGRGGPIPVRTVTPKRQPMPVMIDAVGTVESEHSVAVRPQVSGVLTAVNFKEGDYVKQGQVLFQIDPRPMQAAVEQARAAVVRDEAQLKQAQAQEARLRPLVEKDYVTRQEYDVAATQAKSLEATVNANRAALEQAQIQLAYSRIVAPISGRTGTLGVHQGDLVRANDATPMVVINQVAPIYVTFSVPGRYLGDIRRYQAQKPLEVIAQGQAPLPPGAQAPPPQVLQPSTSQQIAPGQGATMPVKPGLLERGRVSFIDNAVDAQTGTVIVRETLVDHAADNPTWKVFPANPPLDYSNTDTRVQWCWAALTGCALVVVVPTQLFSLFAVKVLRNYTLHKRLQITLGVKLLIAVGLFEVDMRWQGGFEQILAKRSRPLNVAELAFFKRLLLVHLAFAISTVFLWGTTLTLALKRIPNPPVPCAHSGLHKVLGWLSAVDITLTSVTGLMVYYYGFMVP